MMRVCSVVGQHLSGTTHRGSSMSLGLQQVAPNTILESYQYDGPIFLVKLQY